MACRSRQSSRACVCWQTLTRALLLPYPRLASPRALPCLWPLFGGKRFEDLEQRLAQDAALRVSGASELRVEVDKLKAGLEAIPGYETLHELVNETVDERCVTLAAGMEERAVAAEQASRDAIAKGADLEDEVKQRVAVLEANARRSAADLVRLAADAAGKQLASLRETAQEALDARAQTLVDQLMAVRDGIEAQLVGLGEDFERRSERLRREVAGIARSEAKRATPGSSSGAGTYDRAEMERMVGLIREATERAELAARSAEEAGRRADKAEARCAALEGTLSTLRVDLSKKASSVDVSLMIQSSGRRMSVAMAGAAGMGAFATNEAAAAAATAIHEQELHERRRRQSTAPKAMQAVNEEEDGEEEGSADGGAQGGEQSGEGASGGGLDVTPTKDTAVHPALSSRRLSVAQEAALHAVADALSAPETELTLSTLQAQLEEGLRSLETRQRDAMAAFETRAAEAYARRRELATFEHTARELEVLEHRVHAAEDDVLRMATKAERAEVNERAEAAQALAETALAAARRAQETADAAPGVASDSILPRVEAVRAGADTALRDESIALTASFESHIASTAAAVRAEAAATAKSLSASLKDSRRTAKVALEQHAADKSMHGGGGGVPGAGYGERGMKLASKMSQRQFELKRIKGSGRGGRVARPQSARPMTGLAHTAHTTLPTVDAMAEYDLESGGGGDWADLGLPMSATAIITEPEPPSAHDARQRPASAATYRPQSARPQVPTTAAPRRPMTAGRRRPPALLGGGDDYSQSPRPWSRAVTPQEQQHRVVSGPGRPSVGGFRFSEFEPTLSAV